MEAGIDNLEAQVKLLTLECVNKCVMGGVKRKKEKTTNQEPKYAPNIEKKPRSQ